MKIKDSEKLYIYNRDECKCYYCHKRLKYNKITLDHYIPKSYNGTTDVFNLVICCKYCNIQKGNRIPKDSEEVILRLFLKAVTDNYITQASLKIPQNELNEEMLRVTKFERLSNNFIFKSDTKSFHIKNNSVFKLIDINNIPTKKFINK